MDVQMNIYELLAQAQVEIEPEQEIEQNKTECSALLKPATDSGKGVAAAQHICKGR